MKSNNRKALFDSFLDRYFPYAVPAEPKPADAEGDARQVAGEYITSRRPVANILSFIGFLENMKVIPGKDGTVTVDGLKGQNQLPTTWEEIGPLVYREKNGQDLLGFTKDAEGRMVLAMDYPFHGVDGARVAARHQGIQYVPSDPGRCGLLADGCLLAGVPMDTQALSASACLDSSTAPPENPDSRRGCGRPDLHCLLDDDPHSFGGIAALRIELRYDSSPCAVGRLDRNAWDRRGALRGGEVDGVGPEKCVADYVGNVFIAISAISFSWFLLHCICSLQLDVLSGSTQKDVYA